MKKLMICFSFFLFFGMLEIHAEEKKIALLFLTRGDLNHTQIWKEWILNEKYTVYNHAKNKVLDPWFSQFRIEKTYPTVWANTMLAQQGLLKAALKNPDNYKFIFLTESCAPLRTADQVYHLLTSNDKSHIAWKEIWWRNTDRTFFEMPEEYQKGNYSWMVLNRKHAEMIAEDNHWILFANNHLVDNESYPSSFLCMMGVLGEVNNVLTHFVEWERSYNSSPYTFREATEENLKILKNAKKDYIAPDGILGFCLFARKFAPEFPLDVLRQLQTDE